MPELNHQQFVTAYHGTTPENAERLLQQGTSGTKQSRPATVITSESVARMLGKQVGQVADYEVGRGMGHGLYFAPRPEDVQHYGSETLEVRVPREALQIAPERAHRAPPAGRMTPQRSFDLADGYTEHPLGPEAFRRYRPG